MAKRQSFADKLTKKAQVIDCKICNSRITPTMFVIPRKAANGAIKYKKGMVKICKCNHKEYYG